MSAPELRELRLRYSVKGMADLIAHLDNMKLGALPEPTALFIAHASNSGNWHLYEQISDLASALEALKRAAIRFSRAWEEAGEEAIEDYPAFLPSFDEVVAGLLNLEAREGER